MLPGLSSLHLNASRQDSLLFYLFIVDYYFKNVYLGFKKYFTGFDIYSMAGYLFL